MIKKIVSIVCVAAMLASMLGMAATAETVAPSFELQAEPVLAGDTEVKVTLNVVLPEGATGFEVGSFGLELTYDPLVMVPAGEAEWALAGNGMTSQGMFPMPYRILWVSVDEGLLAAGINTVCTITFKLNKVAEAGTEYKFDLAVDDNNGVCSMPSKDGAHTETAYPADGVTVTGATVIAEKGFTYGDANDDGTINLSDVTVVLQQVAKWENVKINLDAADVNADGNLNLSDVTLLLQYIAKWDVTLGPKA